MVRKAREGKTWLQMSVGKPNENMGEVNWIEGSAEILWASRSGSSLGSHCFRDIYKVCKIFSLTISFSLALLKDKL